MKTKSKSVKRKATVEDQMEHHSIGVHKKANVSTLSHMCGDEGPSSIDCLATGSSHHADSQLSPMAVTPPLNHNHHDLPARKLHYIYSFLRRLTNIISDLTYVCIGTHPYVCVNNSANLHLIHCTRTKGVSPVSVIERITNSSANMHSVPSDCCSTPPSINRRHSHMALPWRRQRQLSFATPSDSISNVENYAKDNAPLQRAGYLACI
nr:hypothetical protein [Tanacetum cinerariifolium]